VCVVAELDRIIPFLLRFTYLDNEVGILTLYV
jgi:hypothetical protein